MISIGYVAGFLDADGFVAFKSRTKRGHLELNPLVGFTGTRRDILEDIQDFVGPQGSWIGKTGSKQEHHRQAWQLVWAGGAALEIAKALRPYILMKGPQIDLQQEWKERPRGNRWHGAKPVEDLKARMHALNAKGC